MRGRPPAFPWPGRPAFQSRHSCSRSGRQSLARPTTTSGMGVLEARKIAQADDSPEPGPPPPRPVRLAWLDELTVVSLTVRRLAQLPPDDRPLPSVALYDQLLRRRPSGRPASAGCHDHLSPPQADRGSGRSLQLPGLPAVAVADHPRPVRRTDGRRPARPDELSRLPG